MEQWKKIVTDLKNAFNLICVKEGHGDAPALGSHESGHRHVPGVLDNYQFNYLIFNCVSGGEQ